MKKLNGDKLEEGRGQSAGGDCGQGERVRDQV